MTTRMIQRIGTASRWIAVNPILESGEVGFETDTNKFKIGDGETTWSNLSYFVNESATPDVAALIADAMEDVQTLVATSVSTAVAGLVDSAPAALDTLNELAAAIADDATFANTITNAIANKADATHSHVKSQITDFAHTHPYSELSGVAASSHTHSYSDLSGVAASSHTHTSTEISNVVSTISTTAYSIIASDDGKIIRSTSTSPVTITIDNVFSQGQKVDFYQKGSGQITFVAGSGSVLEGAGSSGVSLKISSQYGAASILCESSGVYAVIGSVETA